MTSERWQQVNDLFQLVAERAPEERTTFLQTACQDDEGLRREVESLIAYYERAENFIESPVFEVVPELLTADRAGAIVGESIAHYRIESLIGIGGMGEVYLARDERLGRKVALKFLPDRLTANKAQLSRFKSEARAASALNHPNILTVYEIGTEGNRHFIATEFIEGVTLRAALARGRMSVHDALEVAVQVASALAAAHGTGVVHRDIKPENIMIRPDGYVKVLDFGLAKLTEQKSASDNQVLTVTNTQHTYAGLLLGTPRYMSPEQTRGEKADARSDIWSLGAVIYEMVGGVPAFSGATPSDCIASILKTEAPPLSRVAPAAPTELQPILHKALRKNRDERYQRITEMLADLRSLKGKLERAASAPKIQHAWVWTAAVAAIVLVGIATFFFVRYRSVRAAARAPSSSSAANTELTAPANIPEKSIAVLPFENRSRDPDNLFFTDGVQDEILTDLAKIADLKVISRTSVMPYKTGAKRNLRQIGNELGVAHVVEGGVQRVGNRVRVNAQLIDARTDAHLWAQTYDRDLADVFAIQSEIAKAIADQLQAKLSPNEKSEIEQPPTTDVIAFDFYSHAKTLFLNAFGSSSGKADLLQAADLLNQAVARDPSFFQAYCQLAFTQVSVYFLDFDHTPSRLAAAEAAVQMAARLQPDAGETHLARARNLYWGYSDYNGALAELEIARQRLPGDNWVFSLKGYIKRREGLWEESLRDLERAIALDPRDIQTLQQTARSYTLLHRYAESKSLLARVLSFEPNDPVTKVLHAFVELDSNGNARPVHEVIDSIRRTNTEAIRNVVNNWLLCALAQRDIAAAKHALAACGKNPILLGTNENVIFPRSFAEGVIARLNHDDDKVRSAFAAAQAEQEKIVQAQANYGPALCVLGLIDAALGRKEQALREGQRAVELVPVEKDALLGPTMIKYLAMIAAWVGDTDLACNQLAMLIRDPSTVSYGQLKLMPFWDPLRGNPRFEKLLEEAKLPVTLSALESGARSAANSTPAPEKSIAVLPFENLSRDPDNAYFAEGIQDEILTRLVAVRDLKVISRTSTAKYQSKPDNLKRVAQELGVSTILEGTVQKAGDKVRVNVQLIDARADTHMWAKSYDRDLKDVLAVESEVSQEIAEALQAKLSPSESHALAAVQTHDAEAYDLFLRGEYEFREAQSSLAAGAYDRADAFYRQALARDPNFAEAAAELARSRLWRHWFVSPLAPAELEEVKSIIARAVALAPNSPESHLALGLLFYWGHRQYEMALAEFNRTLELQPNNALAREYRGAVYRRRGEWGRSLTDFQVAQELDPRDAQIPSNTGQTYQALRLWKDAERAELRALAIDPHRADAAMFLARARLNSTGDVDSARRTLDGFPEAIKSLTRAWYSPSGDVAGITGMWAYLDVIKRHFTDAFEEFEKGVVNDDRTHRQQLAGRAALHVLAGQTEAAKSDGEDALPLLEARLGERPDDSNAMTELSWVYVALGRNDDALRVSRMAADSMPIQKDALSGPIFQNGLAQIEARAGAPDEAIKRLRRLLSIPAGEEVSIARLKVDPVWDPIRNRPDFQQLLSGSEQIGPNK